MRPPLSSSSSKCSSSYSSYSLAPTSLNGRLTTIFKKAQELTTLCDIEACVIHYGPDGELKTWPENRDKVRDLALRYIQLDQAKRRKKNVNLNEFLNKIKDKKTMTNSFKNAKRNLEEIKYPISDHYSVDQINQLIQSLELSYSKLQERRRFLEAKANLEGRQHSLSPSHFTKYPQEPLLKNQEVCVYDQNNNLQHLCVSDHSAAQESGLHYQSMPYCGDYDQIQNMCTSNNGQDPCVSSIQDYSAFPQELQESGLHYQLMPYGGYYDQNMCTGNNFQDPCVSSIQDYSVFSQELQESVSNYGMNQLMQHELFGFDQNMFMSDTTNINNVLDPCLSDDFCFDYQDPYSGFMVSNPNFPQYFNPDMSSSYVDENRLRQASTPPSL